MAMHECIYETVAPIHRGLNYNPIIFNWCNPAGATLLGQANHNTNTQQHYNAVYSALISKISTIMATARSRSSTWMCSWQECSNLAPIPTTAISMPTLL